MTGDAAGVACTWSAATTAWPDPRTGADQVIVLGYDGEPYLRLDGDGVWENERSPAVGLNAERQQGEPAGDADPKAEPSWRKLSGGDTVLFHDHRAHWMGSQPPAAVREDPDSRGGSRTGASRCWSTARPARSRATTATSRRRRRRSGSALLAALALAASVAVWRPKGPRRRLPLWILAGAAVLPAPILGAAETLDLPDPGVDVAAGLAVYTVLIGALAAGAWWARRDPAAEAAILAVAALAVGAFALVGRLALLDHGVVPSALPGWLARGLLVLGLAATIAVAVGAVATWRDTLAGVPTKGGRTRPPRKEPEEAW